MLPTAISALLLSFGLADPPSFDREVLPVLSDFCFHCHGPDAKARKGDLRLDVAADALRKEQPVIVPGNAGASELVRRLESTDDHEMMPPKKLGKKPTAMQIGAIKRWIDSGAKWGKHWSFEPPIRPSLPRVKQTSWVRQPIDQFLLQRLEKEGLTPNPEASRETLIRRLKLDLLGLPPTPGEIDAFLSDQHPGAYERLVERFLSSPHYGERMAWDWLDAARYADSNGYQGDSERTMWPWRDWVVGAFNRNLPFDQFSIWQLAGDQLPGAVEEQKLATGFCRNHMINGEGGRISEENRIEYIFDQAETLGTVWLGLTFNCCRCHDHKFDPISSKDYYSLFAFFNQTQVDGGGGNPQTPPVMTIASKDQRARRADLDKNLKQIAGVVEQAEKNLVEKKAKQTPHKGFAKKPAQRNDGDIDELIKVFAKEHESYGKDLQTLKSARKALEDLDRSLPRVMVMEDMPKPRKSFLLAKGQYNQPTVEITADVPSALPRLSKYEQANRLGLAKWLFTAENPLTARVTVNRFWMQFFGTGLVKTPEDFGVQGERPVHPELLDWLAVDFRESGWDVKRLVRTIVLSAAYRQSSRFTREKTEKDPENRLLARGPRFRMPSWMLRDQALAASGLLVESMGGPPVHPYQPPGIWEEATFGNKRYAQDHGEALYRRTIYTFWRRIVGPTMIFDNAARQVCTVKVFRTNTPLQALLTLNDPGQLEAARHLAQGILKGAASGDPERLSAMHRRVLGRFPEKAELEILGQSLKKARVKYQGNATEAEKLLAIGESKRDASIAPGEHAAWTSVAMVLFNLDETLTKE